MDVDAGRLAASAAELGAHRLHTSQADVSSPQDVARAFEAAVIHIGRLDGLFNNAGTVATRAPLAEIDPAEYDRVVGVNVRGTFLGMRAMLAMAARLRAPAAIVNMAFGLCAARVSGQRLLCREQGSHHLAHRGPPRSRTRSRESESTSSFRSGGHAALRPPSPEVKQRLLENVPLRRPGQPAELAGAAAWLLSEESQYVTGAELRVDGGEAA